MFNDRYGLTRAVLEGRKTMTRRVAKPISENIDKLIFGKLRDGENPYNGGVVYFLDGRIYKPAYKVGEVVAVAQKYEDIYHGLTDRGASLFLDTLHLRYDDKCARDLPAWRNKEFVLADLMPHRIRFTNVRVERLQDISEEDVYKEGFEKETVNNGWGNFAHHWEAMLVYDDSFGRSREIRSRYPRDAFAVLIDKISVTGTWDSNPWVVVYEFELVK